MKTLAEHFRLIAAIELDPRHWRKRLRVGGWTASRIRAFSAIRRKKGLHSISDSLKVCTYDLLKEILVIVDLPIGESR